MACIPLHPRARDSGSFFINGIPIYYSIRNGGKKKTLARWMDRKKDIGQSWHTRAMAPCVNWVSAGLTGH